MSTPTRPILLTGVTGGLGTRVLHDLLHVHGVPASEIIATARSESHRQRFEALGLRFRVLDFDRPETVDKAFSPVDGKSVGDVLFMSSSERDSEKRTRQHGNVIAAAVASAKKGELGRVWYVSLAFGGLGDGSRIGFQQAHYETEGMLARSGLDFVVLRAGVYADAFPLFLNWYPSSRSVRFPRVTPAVTEGKIAFASRDELGESMATLLARGLDAFPSVRPRTGKNIVVLSGPEGESLVDLVAAINRGRGTEMPVEILEPEDWIAAESKDDEGGKGPAWFQARLVFTEGVCGGDAAMVDPALETLLGRRPETGTQTVERLVRGDTGYTWHQNYA